MDELRAFIAELVNATSLRHVAKLIDRGHEQVRKFVEGEIRTPQARTRQAMAELMLARRKVAEEASGTSAGRLSTLLPKGLEKAQQEVLRNFDVLEKSEKAPPTAAVIRQWLLLRLQEEYATEVRYQARPKKEPDDKQEPDDKKKPDGRKKRGDKKKPDDRK